MVIHEFGVKHAVKAAPRLVNIAHDRDMFGKRFCTIRVSLVRVSSDLHPDDFRAQRTNSPRKHVEDPLVVLYGQMDILLAAKSSVSLPLVSFIKA